MNILFRYNSNRHQHLMEESEQALLDAADNDSDGNSHIAKHVLTDAKSHRLWESRHADLVRPIAETSRRGTQLFGLRDIEVKLLHRRALIDYIRKHAIANETRDKLFSVFYGPKETINAILTEHRQYMLAVSSHLSTDHLLNVMCDPESLQLIETYQALYNRYFEMYCYVACNDQTIIADAIKSEMRNAHVRAEHARKRLIVAKPDNQHADFDRQAQLARSGRYPVLNYLVT